MPAPTLAGHAGGLELDGIGRCPRLDVPTETTQLILDFAREETRPLRGQTPQVPGR